jgi:hypothetical protein
MSAGTCEMDFANKILSEEKAKEGQPLLGIRGCESTAGNSNTYGEVIVREKML